MTHIRTYKNFGVALLLCALLIQSFSRVLIISDYYVNTAAYALNCENKAKVEMHCNGQCQMMKKLEQEDKKDQKSPQRTIEYNNLYFIANEFSSALALSIVHQDKQKFPLLPDAKTIDRPHSIFRPPAA